MLDAGDERDVVYAPVLDGRFERLKGASLTRPCETQRPGDGVGQVWYVALDDDIGQCQTTIRSEHAICLGEGRVEVICQTEDTLRKDDIDGTVTDRECRHLPWDWSQVAGRFVE